MVLMQCIHLPIHLITTLPVTFAAVMGDKGQKHTDFSLSLGLSGLM